ncbi:2-C-methyl-D-erythritol 4-phosphate cytidylyltransferase [Mucilaginibacter polytrichastri]|uniref:2-C-methyl-D-erythritol 4-phosphate cytidylyltransferase n=1 Tax=Mucilaginibacter polytrichastri TaxID=1302689 RepID=A0A1Q5ZUR4_9SPHI|nr:2-C-methyl-D-erythritol 4-phosphate cytidylyltransferase [Mucilaginibacter polytrichastri]OKS85511.1 2-C-methyl-D-erythritol 4-phosphate cytidylyltransferase [Mucilaginibacter polytrichastri]SFS37518.1 2-C-methyl-D-erythritol 4-phosphate cytidylyltransferase [Mucilaginibacter polytrichastri]
MPTTDNSQQIAENAYAIIVAGGTGSRMQSSLPKQFLLLNGKPVMMHTIEAFYNSTYHPKIIIILHADFHEYWKTLCTKHQFNIPHQLVNGGETRFHSVKNGLDTIKDNDALVAVQDAVRPLTPIEVINKAYSQANAHGNAIVAVKSRDSIRQLKNGISQHLHREEIYLVQTPQTFKMALLQKAYEQPFDDTFTDDASVVERSGVKINLVEGSHANIKITFPEDIAIAELIQKKPLNTKQL